MKLCETKECTGCMACVNACKHGALTINSDNEGFDHPNLKETLCVDCKLCEKACPILNPILPNNKEQEVYACWTNDIELRLQSSSGGLFTELARIILLKNGIIFGAALDDQLKVYHTYVNSEDQLRKLRGSKYVQSRIENSYQKTKWFLLKGKMVLFSGTPCQIAGLKAYLGQNYENLITVDLICHGVPSPLIYEKYKLYIEKKLDTKIENINFRRKKYSWIFFNISINENSNNKSYIGKYYSDPYIRGFLRDNFLRPSCYDCKFTNLKRMGDITIADYWGYKGGDKEDTNFEELGVSLAIVNTKNGQELFNECKKNLIFFKKNIKNALNTNKSLSKPFSVPLTREAFWKDFNDLTFEEVINNWMRKEKISIWKYLSSNYRHTYINKLFISYFKIIWKVKNKFYRKT
jgi:coenzyme F420-reducing hydrogenase beta subunit